jgi:hypothetical protein
MLKSWGGRWRRLTPTDSRPISRRSRSNCLDAALRTARTIEAIAPGSSRWHTPPIVSRCRVSPSLATTSHTYWPSNLELQKNLKDIYDDIILKQLKD